MPSLTTPAMAYDQRIAKQIDSAREELNRLFDEWIAEQSPESIRHICQLSTSSELAPYQQIVELFFEDDPMNVHE